MQTCGKQCCGGQNGMFPVVRVCHVLLFNKCKKGLVLWRTVPAIYKKAKALRNAASRGENAPECRWKIAAMNFTDKEIHGAMLLRLKTFCAMLPAGNAALGHQSNQQLALIF
ncbi:hypothetical protein [Vandammella animalimorsus]|uniref:hypothetical protein n=1 Tax=Vandammella animalimorsus TaxID=2029117 RepID=UPI0015583328|nr:hypothetical protein [Vandammella animalimorsus]